MFQGGYAKKGVLHRSLVPPTRSGGRVRREPNDVRHAAQERRSGVRQRQ